MTKWERFKYYAPAVLIWLTILGIMVLCLAYATAQLDQPTIIKVYVNQ